jgi:hypothetical protein
MARSSACTEQYAHKVFDRGDIVRETIFQVMRADQDRIDTNGSFQVGLNKSIFGIRRLRGNRKNSAAAVGLVTVQIAPERGDAVEITL